MSQICDEGNQILAAYRPSDLSRLTDEALELIKKYLFPNAHRVNSTKPVSLNISGLPEPYVVSDKEKMVELDKKDLDIKTGKDSTYIRGIYHHNEGRIYLHRDFWCLKTSIHETLHSCSVTSIDSNLLKFKAIFEGLTELYTGFILSKEFCSCYEQCWRLESNMRCQMTYEQPTKIWAAFCNFIPITETFRLYFVNGYTDWTTETENFTSQVIANGYPKFKNPFKSPSYNSHLQLYSECRKNFDSSFKNICINREKFTDFTSIKE